MEQPFSTARHAGKADGFIEKKSQNFHQNQIWESGACEGENLPVLYAMNIVSLVAVENFEWLLMTIVATCSPCYIKGDLSFQNFFKMGVFRFFL